MESRIMAATALREPKLDLIRELNRIERLAAETRDAIKDIDADRGEAVFLTIYGAVTEAIGTIEGVLSAYRYGR
jgi:hypothetical protein